MAKKSKKRSAWLHAVNNLHTKRQSRPLARKIARQSPARDFTTPEDLLNYITSTTRPRSPERRQSMKSLRKITNPIHDCKKEFSKVKSWRAAQATGGAKKHRTPTEKNNNQQSFKQKDC